MVPVPEPVKVEPGANTPVHLQVSWRLVIKMLCPTAVVLAAGRFTGVTVTVNVGGVGTAVSVYPGMTMFCCMESLWRWVQIHLAGRAGFDVHVAQCLNGDVAGKVHFDGRTRPVVQP